MDCKEMALSENYMDLVAEVISLPGSSVDFNIPYCYITLDDAFQIVYIAREEDVGIYFERYGYRNIPKVYGLMQESFDPSSLQVSGILQTQRAPLELTGSGVVMAFIDTGIDYTNPVFRDESGNTRILSIWDQTIQTGTPPEGLVFGSEYTRNDINEALQSNNPYEVVPSRDESGHGSALAGVAAGSKLDGGRTYTGAAPDCDIVVVKLKECKNYLRDYYLISNDVPAYAENDIMLAIKYVERFAITFERPLVICLGIGTNMGDHNGNSFLSRYIDDVGNRRSIGIVVCGGNEGNAAHHYAGLLAQTSQGRVDNYQDVEIRVGLGETGFVLELWGSIPDVVSLYIRSPGGETIPRTNLRIGETVSYSFVYERTRLSIYSVLVEKASGEELIVMRFEEPTEGIWTIRVIAEGSVHNGTFHMWLPISQFLDAETYFLEPSPYVTLTEPAYAKNAMTVSTYNDANNSFYIDSGRGYAKNGMLKPDIAAPGVRVSTIYGEQTGSSLAAAIAAGAFAQFFQWAVVELNSPRVGGRELKNYLIRGASRTNGISYPNREWGYGRLNVAGTFNTLAGLP